MTQYKVINRNTRTQHIMNSNELITFFKINNIREYAISTILSDDDKLQKTLNQISLGILGFLTVIYTTKIIMQWMNI